jgi:hypothetical protein
LFEKFCILDSEFSYPLYEFTSLLLVTIPVKHQRFHAPPDCLLTPSKRLPPSPEPLNHFGEVFRLSLVQPKALLHHAPHLSANPLL